MAGNFKREDMVFPLCLALEDNNQSMMRLVESQNVKVR